MLTKREKSFEHQTGTCQAEEQISSYGGVYVAQGTHYLRDGIKNYIRFRFVLFCFSFWFRPQHQRRPHVHTFYVHHNRQRSGINILVQVFMSSSTLACSSETRNSCDEAISFESHKKSSRRLTSEWHKNSFWLTLTCTKFSLFVCLALSAVDSTLARVQRELLIVVLGIRSSFSDFLHPQRNISFCSSCRREWQVYVTSDSFCGFASAVKICSSTVPWNLIQKRRRINIAQLTMEIWTINQRNKNLFLYMFGRKWTNEEAESKSINISTDTRLQLFVPSMMRIFCSRSHSKRRKRSRVRSISPSDFRVATRLAASTLFPTPHPTAQSESEAGSLRSRPSCAVSLAQPLSDAEREERQIENNNDDTSKKLHHISQLKFEIQTWWK